MADRQVVIQVMIHATASKMTLEVCIAMRKLDMLECPIYVRCEHSVFKV